MRGLRPQKTTSGQHRLVRTTRHIIRRQICHAEMEPDPRVKVLEQVGVLAVAARDKDRVKVKAKVRAWDAAADKVARDVAKAKVWAADKDKVKVKVKVKAVDKDKAAVNQRRPPRIRPKRETSARPRP